MMRVRKKVIIMIQKWYLQNNITDKNIEIYQKEFIMIEENRGQTINKATVRLEEIINTTNNVNTMIEDCFGKH